MDLATRERWRIAPGFSDIYEVSDHGTVRNRNTDRILASSPDPSGTVIVRMARGRGLQPKPVTLGSVLLEAWDKPRPPGRLALPRDGNQANVTIRNFFWGTYEDRASLRRARGNDAMTAGDGNGNAKLSWEAVDAIRELFAEEGCALTNARIALMYGISPSTVSGIRTGRTWKPEDRPPRNI